MQQLGIDITTNNNGIIVHCGNYKPCHITVEADWSSASYLYSMVAAQPQTKIFIPGLTLNSIQGDAVLASLYHTYYGVTTTAASNGVYIQSVSTANDDFFELNLSSYPDLVPALAVTSCLMNKPCVFKGIAHLAHKESNRLQALASELAKAGFNIYAEHDAIKIEKRKDISFKTKEVMTLNTYDDHRLAMSFAILTTHFENLHISNASCVSKSFPQYWDEMKKFGITMGR
jgi:3-phosphoshikimate 1-carboxyvinyltransferase